MVLAIHRVGLMCGPARPEAGVLSIPCSLDRRFEAQVASSPDRIAVVSPGEDGAELSYSELNARANRLARRLRELCPFARQPVALYLEPGIDLVVAILAVLKTGAGYLPLDLSWPRERIAEVLLDADPVGLLTHSRRAAALPRMERPILRIDEEAAALSDRSPANPEAPVDPAGLAYIIYTSGSTGRPKGVLVEHQSVCRLCDSTDPWFDFRPDDTWTLFHSAAFDFSVWEIFGALFHGAKLLIVPQGTRYSPESFRRLLSEERVTVLSQTPSAFRRWMRVEEHDLPLRYVILGGEPLALRTLVPWFERHGDETPRVVNMYGITETTIFVTCRPIRRQDLEQAPDGVIGWPLRHWEVHLLDEDRKPVPRGAPGEIFVGGAGLARGYLNRPELTSARFVQHPQDPSRRLYRSGDRARILESGELQYLGRTDRQVKVRGYRIELDEVQSHLSGAPGLRESFISTWEDENGEQRIAAYVVPKTSPGPAASELAHCLRQRLPEYMVPSAFITVPELPLNENGKVDVRSLPLPANGSSGHGPKRPVQAPDLHELVLAAFREVLGKPELRGDDHFFELGGDSVRAGTLTALLRERLSRPDLQALSIFEHPTVASLSSFLLTRERPRPLPSLRSSSNAVAIVGMAGRFPGAPSIEDFWKNLLAGTDSIRHFSMEELEAEGVDPAELRSLPNYVPARGVLEGADRFDAQFFGYGPAEARLLDPQHRLWLEVAWTALEDAGIDPAQFAGAIGVFAGSSASTYLWNEIGRDPKERERLLRVRSEEGLQALLGNEKDFLATRASYKLGLRGPSVSVQTACSTSLVAVVLACRSLLSFESDACIAGGASVGFPQVQGYLYREGAMLSPDGRCRPFDARAAGTVFGDGVGAVVLERLEDALADGHRVLAVIRGAALRNDGNHKASFSAPSVAGQVEAIEHAYAQSDIHPRSIGYIEAHGTATPLGDPIEVAALTRAFRKKTEDRRFCGLGSVKGNVGHLDAASGITGLIKAALALDREEIPATIHLERENPDLRLDESPFFVVRERRPWKREGSPRRAAVSSLGVGGTNAHVILEEAPRALRSPAASFRRLQLLVLSAKTETALAKSAEALAFYLEQRPEVNLADVAFTLQTGRQAFRERRFLIAGSPTEAASLLRQGPSQSRAKEPARSVVFLFPGQGAQQVDMGRRLYEREPAFRRTVDELCQRLEPLLDLDLRSVLYPDPGDSAVAAQRLATTGLAQPALFVVEYALARLWMDRGLKPEAFIGHSLGEYVSASLAGVFRVEDALRVLAWRGERMQRLPAGAMRAVALPERELLSWLSEEVEIAAVNAPEVSIVSGSEDALAALDRRLERAGHASIPLRTSHAFHSVMVEPAVGGLAEVLASIELHPPQIPFLSGVTGTWITDEEATDPNYWAGQLRLPVRFSEGVRELQKASGRFFLEVGPGHTLASYVVQHGVDPGETASSLEAGEDDEEKVLAAAGRLWLAGISLEWSAFHQGERRQKLSLPTYPFERERFRMDTGSAREAQGAIEEPQLPSGTMSLLREIFSKVIGRPLGNEESRVPFLELGLDSLALTRVSSDLQRRASVRIPFRRMLEDVVTLEALATLVEEERQRPETAPPAQAAAVSESRNRYVEELTRRLNQKTPGSKAATEESRRCLADPRSVSGYRRLWKELVYPMVIERAEGAHLRDIDGNDYIDFTMGFGVNLFGLAPPFVRKAIEAEIARGFSIGPQSPLAGEVARKISQMTGMERVAFANTGSEAVLAALRLARTATGKRKIVYFEGAYHGLNDEVLAQTKAEGSRLRTFPAVAGIPEGSVENALVLPYGDPESLAKIEEDIDEIAGVLVEPVQSRNPALVPVSFLRELRRITEQTGAALIFDEMITGFRAHPGGVQAELGMRSDLATYGKVLGGGLPIGVVAGSPRFMDCLDGGHWRYGDDSGPEADLTYFAATYVRHPLALAAANAVLDHLAQEGPDLQRRLNDRTRMLVRELERALDGMGAAIQIPSYSSWFRLAFAPEVHREGGSSLFFYHLLDQGIHVYSPEQNFFLSTAHSEADLAKFVSAVETSARELQGGGFLPARPAPTAPATRLPLTPAQFEIWYASQMGPVASTAYNESFTLELEGELDLALFRSALNEVLSRHDALRLRFSSDGDEQEIDRGRSFELELREGTPLDEIRRLEAETPFDLVKGPLVRLYLLRFGDRRHAFVMTAHHAVLDGWSAGVVLDELGRTYSARRRGEVPVLAPPIPFESYVAWEGEQESREEGESARSYWSRELLDKPPLLDLPLDRPHPPVRSFRGGTVRQELDPAVLRICREAAARKRTTPFVLLLTAFQSLLYRLSGQPDFTVGLLVGGQAISGMEVLVGHCAKLVPVRSRIEEAMTFASLLERTRAKVLDAGTHQACSYGRMLQGLSVERATGRLPLVEVAFNMDRNIPCRLEGLSTRFSLNPKAAVHFDLFFNLTEGDGTLTIDCDYNRDILDEETVRRWMRHYVTLISTAIASPDVRLCDLPLLSAAEKSLLVSAGNATVWLHRGAETVHGLFATQATQTPDRVALIDPEGALTYGELHHRARRLAQVLRKRGIGPGSVVGLLVDRCSWMVAGLLGILETGAAYLPIAPDWPDDRMRFVLEDAAADLLLSDDPSPIPDSRTPVARIDEDLAIGEPRGMARSEPDSLAYVIYTSGSTGRPKGVQVPHRAVVNLLESMAERPGLDANDRLLAVTTIGFDIAALEIFLPLVVGGTVILVSRPVASHGLQLLWTIRETAPTLLQATPSSWRLLIDSGWDGRPPLKVLCGGEALPRDLRDALLERSENVWNLYGPTETTIWSSCARLSEPNETVVIGRPIAGTELYVVDRFGQIAPPGAPGELYIGGKGLARGYRSRPELTAERYLPDWLGDRSGGRLYRTGDVARYRADGQVEYLGRADDQLKIRGYRIEPGEIEALLVECCHVKECVVVARELQPDDVRLLAYFVPRAGRAPTRTEIRQELRLKLPDSMIPQYFVELESIPRTSNGKVDRRALPDVLRVSGLDQPPAPPETRAEKMLAELWSHALDQQKVSVSDNFFALGGHSLLAMKLLLEIERRTGCRLNPMSFVFDTLGQIAARLETSWNPVEAVERRAESSHPAVGLGSRLFRAFRSRVH